MLLPDNIQPELTVYYNGSLVLEELRHNNAQSIMQLFLKIKEKTDMSFSMFLLCLDWLYLINVARINEKGDIEICSLIN